MDKYILCYCTFNLQKLVRQAPQSGGVLAGYNNNNIIIIIIRYYDCCVAVVVDIIRAIIITVIVITLKQFYEVFNQLLNNELVNNNHKAMFC